MIPFKNNKVEEKFSTYPTKIREKLLDLRQLIFDVATEHKIQNIEETLKWNEPSYLSKLGSTIRINCKTKIVPTFRKLFNDRFAFIGNREIEFSINDNIDFKALKYCILLSLTYHQKKYVG
jgi:hypothetical protein